MTSNWPDPAKPGVPLNPERDGWHWVGNVVREWHAQFQIWQDRHGYCIPPATWGLLQYGGLCLTPAEVAAREQAARREGMKEAARIADGVEPSAASAVGEAHMRSFRNAIAYAIRAAAKEGSDE